MLMLTDRSIFLQRGTFDNVNPGDCGRVEWTIINEGTKAVELRVKLEEEWEDELDTDNFFYAPAPGSDWVMYEDEDGIWLYYVGGPVAGTYGLEEGEEPESVKLELVVAFDGELTDDDYQGLGFTLSGKVYAIQASNDAPSIVWGDAWDAVTQEDYEPFGVAATYLNYIKGTRCWGGDDDDPQDPPVVEGEIVDAEIIYSGSMSGSKSPAGSLNLTFSPVRIENAKDGNGNLLNGEYNLVLWLDGFEGDSDQYGYPLSLNFTDGNTGNFGVSGWYLFGSGSYHVPNGLYLTFGAN